jgi:hypothetical protein
MTFSILMYALMISSLAALVGTLVVDAVRGRRPEPAPRRSAEPALQRARGRLVQRGDCPRPLQAATPAEARARRGGTPRSCRR